MKWRMLTWVLAALPGCAAVEMGERTQLFASHASTPWVAVARYEVASVEPQGDAARQASLIVAKSESPPPPSPSPPLVESSPEATPASADEPPAVRAFARFIQNHLITFSMNPTRSRSGVTFIQGQRSFTLLSADLLEAFTLVPESATLAQQAQSLLPTSIAFSTIGLGVSLGIAVGAMVLSLTGTLPLVVAIISVMVGGAVGTGLLVVGMSFGARSQESLNNAILTYNRELFRLRPVHSMSDRSPQLSVVLARFD